jgi:hypothetical protein
MKSVYWTAAKRTAKFFGSILAAALVIVGLMSLVSYLTGMAARYIYDIIVLTGMAIGVYWYNLDDAKKELTNS